MFSKLFLLQLLWVGARLGNATPFFISPIPISDFESDLSSATSSTSEALLSTVPTAVASSVAFSSSTLDSDGLQTLAELPHTSSTVSPTLATATAGVLGSSEPSQLGLLTSAPAKFTTLSQSMSNLVPTASLPGFETSALANAIATPSASLTSPENQTASILGSNVFANSTNLWDLLHHLGKVDNPADKGLVDLSVPVSNHTKALATKTASAIPSFTTSPAASQDKHAYVDSMLKGVRSYVQSPSVAAPSLPLAQADARDATECPSVMEYLETHLKSAVVATNETGGGSNLHFTGTGNGTYVVKNSEIQLVGYPNSTVAFQYFANPADCPTIVSKRRSSMMEKRCPYCRDDYVFFIIIL